MPKEIPKVKSQTSIFELKNYTPPALHIKVEMFIPIKSSLVCHHEIYGLWICLPWSTLGQNVRNFLPSEAKKV